MAGVPRELQAGIDARLVTISGITGGAMSEVPRQTGASFLGLLEP